MTRSNSVPPLVRHACHGRKLGPAFDRRAHLAQDRGGAPAFHQCVFCAGLEIPQRKVVPFAVHRHLVRSGPCARRAAARHSRATAIRREFLSDVSLGAQSGQFGVGDPMPTNISGDINYSDLLNIGAGRSSGIETQLFSRRIHQYITYDRLARTTGFIDGNEEVQCSKNK